MYDVSRRPRNIDQSDFSTFFSVNQGTDAGCVLIMPSLPTRTRLRVCVCAAAKKAREKAGIIEADSAVEIVMTVQ